MLSMEIFAFYTWLIQTIDCWSFPTCWLLIYLGIWVTTFLNKSLYFINLFLLFSCFGAYTHQSYEIFAKFCSTFCCCWYPFLVWCECKGSTVFSKKPQYNGSYKIRNPKKSAIWDIMLCNALKIIWRSGGTYHVHLQGSKHKPNKKQAWNQQQSLQAIQSIPFDTCSAPVGDKEKCN